MRFQDWDILLYPKGCEVPFKEFKTTCYAAQDDHGGAGAGITPTPLLTCFVPSIPEGRPFSISLHSWTTPGHVGLQAMPGLKSRALWQVKIVVDGTTIATHLCPHDCSWPQVLTEGTIVDINGMTTVRQLAWPGFHKSATTQRQWDAADPAGRIKVELAAGFNEELGGKTVFTKLSTIVCFAFFPAPIGHLECVGIAWPNKKMFETPLLTAAQQTTHGGLITAPELIGSDHRRTYSSSSFHGSSPLRGMPVPPPPTPAMGYCDHQALQAAQMQSLYDIGINGPPMASIVNGQDPLGVHGPLAVPANNENYRQAKTQLEVRLPSDQLQKLIVALSPSKPVEAQPTDYTHMPPPPLPLHALAAKAGGNSQSLPSTFRPEQSSANDQSATLHSASRGSSDISMHTSCTQFPTCMSEDDSSLVVHSSPAFPSSSIKGRKEGSSPEKPRDFLSTILGPQDHDMASPKKDEKRSSDVSSSSPVETPGRKRTRSALKALTLHDGSLEQKDPSARKPFRKVSRASSGDSKRARDVAVAGAHMKTSVFDEEDKENQMILDV